MKEALLIISFIQSSILKFSFNTATEPFAKSYNKLLTFIFPIVTFLIVTTKVTTKSFTILIGGIYGTSRSGGRFKKYFSDFEAKYHFHDMYSGAFADFSSLEENWAYWSRFIYINRYMDAPLPVYEKLLELVRGKDYFVITTNVDHCFQKAGFDKKRLFYTQGDYGLFQCCVPCHKKTYNNEEIVKKMLVSQGFGFKDSENKKDGEIIFPENPLKMEIPSELVPHCPVCGKPMSMNLRCDGTFVEDDGWHEAAKRYQDFLEKHKNARTLFLELGVGENTPGIIKYPF